MHDALAAGLGLQRALDGFDLAANATYASQQLPLGNYGVRHTRILPALGIGGYPIAMIATPAHAGW